MTFYRLEETVEILSNFFTKNLSLTFNLSEYLETSYNKLRKYSKGQREVSEKV